MDYRKLRKDYKEYNPRTDNHNKEIKSFLVSQIKDDARCQMMKTYGLRFWKKNFDVKYEKNGEPQSIEIKSLTSKSAGKNINNRLEELMGQSLYAKWSGYKTFRYVWVINNEVEQKYGPRILEVVGLLKSSSLLDDISLYNIDTEEFLMSDVTTAFEEWEL